MFKKHVHTNYYGAETERTAVGCQCKHVLGYACQTPISKLPNNLRNHTRLAEAAIQRLRTDFDFIGATDDFDASTTLAHQMLGEQLDVNTGFIHMNSREQVGKFRATHDRGSDLLAAIMTQPSMSPDDKYNECDRFIRPGSSEPCSNPPDESFFSEVQRLVLREILIHHHVPVRFVDTSPHSWELVTPRESNQMEPSNTYSRNVTRVLKADWSMSDDKCVVLG